MKFEQELKSYYHDVKARLLCPPEDAARCIADIERSVNSFLDDFPNASFEEVKDFLGDAEDMARVFRESLDPQIILRYQQKRCFYKRGFAALIAACILVFIGIAVYSATRPPKVDPSVIVEQTIYVGDSYDDPTAVNPN